MPKQYRYACAVCGKRLPMPDIEIHQNKCYGIEKLIKEMNNG